MPESQAVPQGRAAVPAALKTNGRAAMAVLIYLGFTLQLLQVGIIPLLPILGKQLHITLPATSWLLTAALLSGALALPIITKLADRFGVKRMIVVSLGLMLVGSLLASFTDSYPLLIVGRVLMGAQMPMLALPEAIANDTMPPERAQFTISSIHSGNGVGVGGGLVLGALVGIYPGAWHAYFYVGAVTAAIGIISTLTFVRDSPVRRQGRVDWVGAAGLALALGALLFGLSEGPGWGWGSPAVVGLLAGGVVVGVLWLWYSGRVPHPLIHIRDIVKREMRVPYAMTFMIAFCIYASLSAITRLAQSSPAVAGFGYGYSTVQNAWFGIPEAVGSIAGAFLLQQLRRRRGRAFTACVGLGLSAVAFVISALLYSSPYAMMTGIAIFAVGLVFTLSCSQLLVLHNSSHTSAGIVLGMTIVMYALGNSLGSDVIGVFFASFTGPRGAPALNAYLVSFWVCAGVCVLGVLLAAHLVRRTRTTDIGTLATVPAAAEPQPTAP